MNIWTESLERKHLPLLKSWIGRIPGKLTANDLPLDPEALTDWFERRALESGRLDFLVSVYETPVGVAGLRVCDGEANTAGMYLLLGEANYNPLRTATYATLQILDRAFQECGFDRVCAEVYAKEHKEYLEALERMGFSKTAEASEKSYTSIERKLFLDRKYLF